jgi:hypothetical protein
MNQTDDNKAAEGGSSPLICSPPRRRVVCNLKIQADSIKDLTSALRCLETDIYTGTRNCVSGGYSSGYILEIDEDESITHDSWFETLEAHLESVKENATEQAAQAAPKNDEN